MFLSHAHIDHLGGLLSEESKPVFGSAQHFVHDREWEFWTGKSPDLSKQRLDDKTKADFIQLAQRTFGTMESNFKRVSADQNLIDGVAMQAAPGHGWRHGNVIQGAPGKSHWSQQSITNCSIPAGDSTPFPNRPVSTVPLRGSAGCVVHLKPLSGLLIAVSSSAV